MEGEWPVTVFSQQKSLCHLLGTNEAGDGPPGLDRQGLHQASDMTQRSFPEPIFVKSPVKMFRYSTKMKAMSDFWKLLYSVLLSLYRGIEREA